MIVHFLSSIFQNEESVHTNTNCNNNYDNCNSITQDTYPFPWNSYQQACQSDPYYWKQQQNCNTNTRILDQWDATEVQSSYQHVAPGVTSQHVQQLSHLTPPFIDTESPNDTSKIYFIIFTSRRIICIKFRIACKKITPHATDHIFEFFIEISCFKIMKIIIY